MPNLSRVRGGRVLAIARAGVLPERISLGVQLLLSSVQRRVGVFVWLRKVAGWSSQPDCLLPQWVWGT